MTQKQHKWYLREWSAAFRVHWAGTKGGEAIVRSGRPPCPMRDKVMAAAGRLASTRKDGRISADLIRRACHLVGTGKDISSWSLTNKQVDQVVAVFRVLSQVRDVAAQMRLDAADVERARMIEAGRSKDSGMSLPPSDAIPDADRVRCLYSLSKTDLPPAYVREISSDKYGTPNWESLPARQLHQLLITCKVRAAARLVAGARRAATTIPSNA
jgi:hypothetical protein